MTTKTAVKPQYTPLPWRVAESVSQKDCFYLEAKYESSIGPKEQWLPIGEDDGTFDYEDAAFIVKAVNCHEDLINGLVELRDRLQIFDDKEGGRKNAPEIEFINSLLAKAEGQ